MEKSPQVVGFFLKIKLNINTTYLWGMGEYQSL